MEKKVGTLIKVVAVKRASLSDPNTLLDSLILFYRDKDGNKIRKFIPRAEIPYSLLKDRESPEAQSQPMFIEQSKVETFTTFSDNLYHEVAGKTGTMPFFYEVYQERGRNAGDLKNILKHPLCYDADMDVSDRYIQFFHEEFEPDTSYKLKKGFFDIEVDLMEHGWVKDKDGRVGYVGFPDEETAPCQISIITYFHEPEMKFFCFILRNPLNTSQAEMLSKKDEFNIFVKDWIKENDNIEIADIEFIEVDKEEDLILSFFRKVRELDPDFSVAWNAGYDCNTLINRLAMLRSRNKAYQAEYNEKYNPGGTRMLSGREIANREILDQSCRFFQVEGTTISLEPKPFYKQEKDKLIVDRTECLSILDGINWFDAMGLFASIRKSSGQRESYSLDAIANDELGKEKLPFKDGQTIKNVPWLDFWQYLHYNIVDVLRLYQLESKNLDLDMLQRLSEITNTRKEKVFKKTVSLKNYVSKFARDNGYIMANNRNGRYGTEENAAKFTNRYVITNPITEQDPAYKQAFEKKENFGAYVGDPLLNAPEGIDIFGKRSMFLFENVGDQDFASLYPSIIRALNLDPTTQLGKFFWLDSEIKKNLLDNYNYSGLFATSKNEDADSDSTDIGTNDMGTTLVDSLHSQNWGRIGEKFFKLPSTEEIIKRLRKKDKA